MNMPELTRDINFPSSDRRERHECLALMFLMARQNLPPPSASAGTCHLLHSAESSCMRLEWNKAHQIMTELMDYRIVIG